MVTVMTVIEVVDAVITDVDQAKQQQMKIFITCKRAKNT